MTARRLPIALTILCILCALAAAAVAPVWASSATSKTIIKAVTSPPQVKINRYI